MPHTVRNRGLTLVEIRVLHPSIGRDVGCRSAGRRVQIGILQQDLLLQAAQPRRRHDAELLAEHLAGRPVGAQRVGLTAAPVERHHVECPEFFTVRM